MHQQHNRQFRFATSPRYPSLPRFAEGRDCRFYVQNRAQREPEFAAALLDEAVTLFLNGEPETARLMLRELVNSTVGFEALAIETAKPTKSLHRMLSASGNPTMDNLTSILSVLRKKLKLAIKVETIPSA